MTARVQQCRDDCHASGMAGFGSLSDLTAILLPGQPESQPLALVFVYEASELIDAATLLQTLKDSLARCLEDAPAQPATVSPLFNAA